MIKLFITFFKIGLTTFGGGYAMLPILIREISENNNWATEDELLEYFAIGQATPGIIAVNTATFVGHKIAGTIGAIVATFGFVLPSIIVITLIMPFIGMLESRFYYGTKFLKIAVSGLIFHTIYKMFLKQIGNLKSIIYIVIALSLALLKVPLPLIVVGFSLFAVLESRYA